MAGQVGKHSIQQVRDPQLALLLILSGARGHLQLLQFPVLLFNLRLCAQQGEGGDTFSVVQSWARTQESSSRLGPRQSGTGQEVSGRGGGGGDWQSEAPMGRDPPLPISPLSFHWRLGGAAPPCGGPGWEGVGAGAEGAGGGGRGR